jgi:uncharacterized membrane protein (UPF0136 family)
MEQQIAHPTLNPNGPTRPAHRTGVVKLIAGVFFSALGIVLTAGNLDLIDSDDYVRYWPAVLVVLGLAKLVDGSRVVPVILMVVGAGLLALNLGWVRISVFDLWPLLLIAFGLAMVGRAVGWVPDVPVHKAVRGEGISIFDDRKVTNNSQDYRGGRITTALGGYQLDLTGARMAQSPAIIEIFAMMGGIEILVPDDWEVVGEAMPIMAGFDIKTTGATDSKQQLIVRGLALWSGIEVKSMPRRPS